MKTRHLLALLLISSLAIVSCAKQFSSIWMLYEESYCADPWGHDFAEEKLKFQAVEAYLDSANVRTYKVVQGVNIDAATCQECLCGSGGVLRVKIHEDDLQTAIDLGFYREK